MTTTNNAPRLSATGRAISRAIIGHADADATLDLAVQSASMADIEGAALDVAGQLYNADALARDKKSKAPRFVFSDAMPPAIFKAWRAFVQRVREHHGHNVRAWVDGSGMAYCTMSAVKAAADRAPDAPVVAFDKALMKLRGIMAEMSAAERAAALASMADAIKTARTDAADVADAAPAKPAASNIKKSAADARKAMNAARKAAEKGNNADAARYTAAANKAARDVARAALASRAA